jgi:hypothetical protein
MPAVDRHDIGAPDAAMGMAEKHKASGSAKPLVRQVPRAMRHILSLDDLEKAARRHLPRPISGYVYGAAEDNLSRDDNRQVFSEDRFVTWVLRNVSARSQATERYVERPHPRVWGNTGMTEYRRMQIIVPWFGGIDAPRLKVPLNATDFPLHLDGQRTPRCAAKR